MTSGVASVFCSTVPKGPNAAGIRAPGARLYAASNLKLDTVNRSLPGLTFDPRGGPLLSRHVCRLRVCWLLLLKDENRRREQPAQERTHSRLLRRGGSADIRAPDPGRASWKFLFALSTPPSLPATAQMFVLRRTTRRTLRETNARGRCCSQNRPARTCTCAFMCLCARDTQAARHRSGTTLSLNCTAGGRIAMATGGRGTRMR